MAFRERMADFEAQGVHPVSDDERRAAGIRLSAEQRFASMTPAEQDEAFGPGPAEALRKGTITFADLVQRERFDGDADSFITQRPLKDAN